MGNLKYDLHDYRDWLAGGRWPDCEPIVVGCSDGSHVMRLATDADGEGLYMRTADPDGGWRYEQVAPPGEFSLPGSEHTLRRLMREEFKGMERMCEETGYDMPDEFWYTRRR